MLYHQYFMTTIICSQPDYIASSTAIRIHSVILASSSQLPNDKNNFLLLEVEKGWTRQDEADRVCWMDRGYIQYPTYSIKYIPNDTNVTSGHILLFIHSFMHSSIVKGLPLTVRQPSCPSYTRTEHSPKIYVCMYSSSPVVAMVWVSVALLGICSTFAQTLQTKCNSRFNLIAF